ncbi:hypothetical protein HK102_011376, partial [Quaeritorhiza haematococci]
MTPAPAPINPPAPYAPSTNPSDDDPFNLTPLITSDLTTRKQKRRRYNHESARSRSTPDPLSDPFGITMLPEFYSDPPAGMGVLGFLRTKRRKIEEEGLGTGDDSGSGEVVTSRTSKTTTSIEQGTPDAVAVAKLPSVQDEEGEGKKEEDSMEGVETDVLKTDRPQTPQIDNNDNMDTSADSKNLPHSTSKSTNEAIKDIDAENSPSKTASPPPKTSVSTSTTPKEPSKTDAESHSVTESNADKKTPANSTPRVGRYLPTTTTTSSSKQDQPPTSKLTTKPPATITTTK